MARFEHGERVEFRNTTNHLIGVSQYLPNGDETAVAVGPGETVWLSEAEQELTAKAPKQAAANPFLPQPFKIVDPTTDEVLEEGSRPWLVINDEDRPIGAYAAGEETGVPAPPRRRKRATA